MFLFIIIEVVRGFKNIEVASSLSTEMCVYVCVARIACAADQPTNRDAGRSRGRAAGRSRGRAAGRGAAAAGPGRDDADDEAPSLSYDDDDVSNDLPSFDSSNVGFQLPGHFIRGSLTKAINFFDLFFDKQIVSEIVKHTNSYAQEKIFLGQVSSYTQSDGSWKDVTADEIKRFIALLIHFGVVHVRGDVQRNWSTKTLYHGLWARAILPRNRFFAILAFLHVVDPATETPGNKLCKVESFVKHFKKRCSELYKPREHVAIDERMVKSRHRSGIRQYIRDKPTKWGIKLWVLADSSNGYTVDFNIYIGRAAGREVSANGLGYDVVMRLIAPYYNKGYHLFVDNFYSSLTLFRDLFDNGVLATGTILPSRRSFPAALKNTKEWAKGKERGCMRWVRDPPCLVLQWVDNKVVSMITTVGNANDHVQVSRKQRNAGSWTNILVQQPQIFQTYNLKMNAVDRSDQILSTFNIQRKCLRWWKTMFFHLIDMAVVNSYILFLEHMANYPDEIERPAGYTQCDFRDELVREICGLPEYGDPPLHTSGRPRAPSSVFETEHIPCVSDTRRNCVVCYKLEKVERKTNSYCDAPQCEGKYMHIAKDRNCFRIFHSKEYHKQ